MQFDQMTTRKQKFSPLIRLPPSLLRNRCKAGKDEALVAKNERIINFGIGIQAYACTRGTDLDDTHTGQVNCRGLCTEMWPVELSDRTQAAGRRRPWLMQNRAVLNFFNV